MEIILGLGSKHEEKGIHHDQSVNNKIITSFSGNIPHSPNRSQTHNLKKSEKSSL